MKSINIIVTLDDKGGVMFNNRRQSRDRILVADICSSLEHIYVSEYTAPLFADYPDSVTVSSTPFEDCPDGMSVFAEGEPVANIIDMAGAFTVYRWNRHYPSDRWLDVDIESCGFILVETCEFAGSSHEKITKEIYIRAVP